MLLGWGGDGTNVPNKIIVHAMAEYVLGDDGLYYPAAEYLAKAKLSAHLLVEPDGNVIRCREDNQIAWHAKGYNTNSLGIEILIKGRLDYTDFVDAMQHPWATTQQFFAAAYYVRHWMNEHHIPLPRVFRHSDIDPSRKKDPGNGFPWELFTAQLT